MQINIFTCFTGEPFESIPTRAATIYFTGAPIQAKKVFVADKIWKVCIIYANSIKKIGGIIRIC